MTVFYGKMQFLLHSCHISLYSLYKKLYVVKYKLNRNSLIYNILISLILA